MLSRNCFILQALHKLLFTYIQIFKTNLAIKQPSPGHVLQVLTHQLLHAAGQEHAEAVEAVCTPNTSLPVWLSLEVFGHLSSSINVKFGECNANPWE